MNTLLHKVGTLFLLLALQAFLAAPVNAALVSFDFVGRVIFDRSPFGIDVDLNDVVVASISYDTSVIDTNIDPRIGFFPQTIPNGLTFVLPNNTLTSSSYKMRTFNQSIDTIGPEASPGNAFIDGVLAPDLRMGIDFQDSSGQFLPSDALPSTLLPFNSFTLAQGFIQDTRTFELINFRLVAPDPPSAVPIPAAVWFFGTALIGLVGFGRRKSRIAA